MSFPDSSPGELHGVSGNPFFQDLNSPWCLLFHSEHLLHCSFLLFYFVVGGGGGGLVLVWFGFVVFFQASILCWRRKALNINIILTTKIPKFLGLTDLHHNIL